MAWHHRLVGTAVRTYRRARGRQTLGVRGLVLDEQGRIALVLHTYIDGWYLPGGGVQRGERFDQALARELREEIGVTDIQIERVLGVYHNTSELRDDHVVVFVVRTTATRLVARSTFEIQDAQWFALDNLPDDTSPATARRIAEYRDSVNGMGDW